MQTKMGSFVEAAANIVVGFSINYVANLLIFPLFGFHISLTANFVMGLIYTVISLVRSYVLRRWFNGLKFGNTASKATTSWAKWKFGSLAYAPGYDVPIAHDWDGNWWQMKCGFFWLHADDRAPVRT